VGLSDVPAANQADVSGHLIDSLLLQFRAWPHEGTVIVFITPHGAWTGITC
jgi:hypothetical protein